MFILYLFAIIFLLFAIYFGIKTIKEKELTGINAFKTFMVYLFFAISMGLFFIFIDINYKVSIIIFLCLFWICLVSSMFDSKKISFVTCDLGVLTISIIFLLILPVPENIISLNYFSIFLFFLLFSIYLLPLLACVDRKRDVLIKIKNCTYEVTANVIDVIYHKKGKIYIPKIEFEFNGKTYKYYDSDTLYFSDKIDIGEKISLLINPELKKFNKNNNSVFFPGREIKEFMGFEEKIWYIVLTLIFLLIFFI